jgi:hypothetical protein
MCLSTTRNTHLGQGKGQLEKEEEEACSTFEYCLPAITTMCRNQIVGGAGKKKK